VSAGGGIEGVVVSSLPKTSSALKEAGDEAAFDAFFGVGRDTVEDAADELFLLQHAASLDLTGAASSSDEAEGVEIH
jgi:hypothetical protein